MIAKRVVSGVMTDCYVYKTCMYVLISYKLYITTSYTKDIFICNKIKLESCHMWRKSHEITEIEWDSIIFINYSAAYEYLQRINYFYE